MLVPEFGLLRYWSTSISREMAWVFVRVRFNPRISDAVCRAGFDVAGRSGIADDLSSEQESRTFSAINISAI